MYKKVLVLCLVGAVAWVFAGDAQAGLVNGDFSGGLTGWTTTGDVGVAGGAAVLGDLNSIDSQLFQGVALAPGEYTIQFDYSNLLSSFVPSGGFPDTHFASLYFINDFTKFDLNTASYDNAAGLFNLDYTGPSGVSGVISPSTLGADWSHFSMTFANNYDYVIPTFELMDFNFVNGDSQVLLDNVYIGEVVPEPSTLLLLGMGLASVALRGRKARATK